MNLTKFAIENKALSYFVALLILLGGIGSFLTLGQLEDPNFTEADPECAMCYWGKAYALGPNYNNVEMTPDGPHFADQCMLCMRCYSFCPVLAIQATPTASTLSTRTTSTVVTRANPSVTMSFTITVPMSVPSTG